MSEFFEHGCHEHPHKPCECGKTIELVHLVDNADKVHTANNVSTTESVSNADNVAYADRVETAGCVVVEYNPDVKLTEDSVRVCGAKGIVDAVKSGIAVSKDNVENFELYENAITSGSKKAVQSGAVYTSINALNAKIDAKTANLTYIGAYPAKQISDFKDVPNGNAYRAASKGTITSYGGITVTDGDLIAKLNGAWKMIVDINAPMFIQNYDSYDYSSLSSAIDSGAAVLIRKENANGSSGYGYSLYHVTKETIRGSYVFVFRTVEFVDNKVCECMYTASATSMIGSWTREVSKSSMIVPTPLTTGTFVLKSVNGSVSWVAE